MPTAAASPTNKWLVTMAGMSGAIAMVMSSTIANVAVPTVMGAFGIGQDQAQWLATAFIATMVASQLLSAWFVSALGVRVAFLVINGVFFTGTAITYFSPNFEMLVVGRVLQGFSAGIIQPMTMALIFVQFPPNRRGQAMGIHSMGIQVAPMLGPMIGGLIIDTVGWREIFLMPIPICVVSVVLGILYLPGREEQGALPKFDWLGYGLLVTTLGLLLFVGANGQRYGWSSDIIVIMALVCAASGTGFVWLQLRAESPLLDCTLFKNSRFTSAIIVAFVFGLGNFASNYLIPVAVQEVQGLTPFLSGLLLVPAGILVFVGMPVFGRAADSFPARRIVICGLCMFALGNFLMGQTDVNTTFATFAFLVVISRCGMALISPAVSSAALKSLPHEQLQRGAGTLNFARQLGGALGVTSLVIFIERRTQYHVDAMAATQSVGNTTSQELLSTLQELLATAGVTEDIRGPGALHILGQMVEAQASARGFSDGFLIIAVVFILAVIPAWNLRRARK